MLDRFYMNTRLWAIERNWRQKREKHFVVSSAHLSTQKIVLWIFLVSKLPDKIPKPYLQPFGHPHHKVKNRRFAPKVEQTLSLDLVSPSFLPKAGILLVGIFKWCGHHCGWDLRRLPWACSDKVESKPSAKPQGLKIQQVFLLVFVYS